MRAWIFQDTRQKQKLGSKAPWSVGWFDPDGKKRSKRIGSKSLAEKFSRKTEGELAAGTYLSETRMKWAELRQMYEQRVLELTSSGNQVSARISFDHFERIIKPMLVRTIKTATIDDYKAKRRVEKGLRARERRDRSPSIPGRRQRRSGG